MAATIPTGDNSAALADWLESVIVAGGIEALSLVRVSRLLKGEGTELADLELREEAELEGLPQEQELEAEETEADLSLLGNEAEMERDERIDLLVGELQSRADLGSGIYPFRVQDEQVERVEACGEGVYLLLLALGSATASYREERRAHEAEAAFDHVALAALKRYLGRRAEGVRFALSSADDGNGMARPALFSEAVEWLRDLLDARTGTDDPSDEDNHEAHWEAADGANPAPILNTYKDAGVDVVVWSKFGDGRPGFPVVLAQCTVQLNWQGKLADIPLQLWERWINFSMVPPQTALVIPFGEDPRSAHWEDRCLRAGMVIDRLRLLELLSDLSCEELEALVPEETKEWAVRELATV